MKKLLRLCLLLITVFSIASCGKQNTPAKQTTVAKQGVIDLTNWDFDKDGIVKLNGEWEFYWKKLLTPLDLKNANYSNYLFHTFPYIWNGTKVDGEVLGGDGYATFRLTILLNEKFKNRIFSILTKEQATAYRLFINGEETASAGLVSDKREEGVPHTIPSLSYFETKTDRVELVLQVSNYHHRSGGIWQSISFGSEKAIDTLYYDENAIALFLAGTLFIMGIYHLGLFILRNKDYSLLIFAFFCLDVLLRLIVTEEKVLLNIIPSLPFSVYIRIEYLTFFFGVSIAIHFINAIYPEELKMFIVKIFYSFSIFFSLFTLLTPSRIFSEIIQPFQIITLLGLIIILFSVVKAIVNKRDHSVLFLTGMLVIILTAINDILYTNQVIRTIYMAHFGFLFLVLSQSFILSMNFAAAFKKAEELSEHLELKVIERTRELEIAKTLAETEQEKSEKLLLNILPRDVAEELKSRGYSEPVMFESVSVLFTDFKGFTKIAEKLTPGDLIKELDACFVQFDKITERYKLEKLKTIGDSYMCAGGIPRRNKTHAIDCIIAAIEIQNFMNQMKEIKESLGMPYWELRLGIHSGPLVAGVIGEKKFAYDVWGDTVNTASRMESSGTPGMINISGTTYEYVKDFFDCEYRGKINAKNKGEVDMYYITGIKKEFSKSGDGKTPNQDFFDRYAKV